MNLFLRLLWLSLTARWRPACAVLGPCITPFRVCPSDLDVLRHVNNGVYLSLCDLARLDQMRRSGLWPKLRSRGLYPVIAAETILFRKSLRLGERFRIQTRVLGWDERVFFIEHRFWRHRDELICAAIVSARFLRSTGGGVPPAEIVTLAGLDPASPALPEWVARWSADLAAWRETISTDPV